MCACVLCISNFYYFLWLCNFIISGLQQIVLNTKLFPCCLGVMYYDKLWIGSPVIKIFPGLFVARCTAGVFAISAEPQAEGPLRVAGLRPVWPLRALPSHQRAHHAGAEAGGELHQGQPPPAALRQGVPQPDQVFVVVFLLLPLFFYLDKKF